jgi:hypothetical protein
MDGWMKEERWKMKDEREKREEGRGMTQDYKMG